MYEKLIKEKQEQFAVLRRWIDSQPHFPKNISELTIQKY